MIDMLEVGNLIIEVLVLVDKKRWKCNMLCICCCEIIVLGWNIKEK